MTKIEKHRDKHFYDKVIQLLKKARKSVVQTVNKTMVYTYFEIGRIIVEEEQKGKARAEYGKQILKSLSEKLTKEFGKGFSVTNLKQMRQFYITYSKSQTLSDEFSESRNSLIIKNEDSKSETVSRKFENIDFQLKKSEIRT